MVFPLMQEARLIPLPRLNENEYPGKTQAQALEQFKNQQRSIFVWRKTYFVRFNRRCSHDEIYYKVTLNIFQRALRALLLCVGNDPLMTSLSKERPLGNLIFRDPWTEVVIHEGDPIFTTQLVKIDGLKDEEKPALDRLNQQLLRHRYRYDPIEVNLQIDLTPLSTENREKFLEAARTDNRIAAYKDHGSQIPERTHTTEKKEGHIFSFAKPDGASLSL